MRARVGGFILILLVGSLLLSCRGFFQPESNTGNGGGGGGTTTARFAYVANSQSGSIAAFTVGSNGQLTAISGSPFGGVVQQPSGLAVTPAGDFLFVTDQNGPSVTSFPIVTTSGALGTGSPSQTQNLQPVSVAVTPNGSFSYVLDKGVPTGTTVNGDVEPYTIGSLGVLVPISGNQKSVGLDPWTITVDLSGKFLYVAGGVSGTWVFSIQTVAPTGSLLQVGQPLTTITGISRDIAIDPATKFAYVANGSTGVETYSIAADGSLSHIGGVTGAGSSPNRVAVSPNGKFAYVVNQSSNNISEYSITNGTLSSIGTVQTGAGPNAIAIDPSSAFVYVTNFTDGTLSVFSIGSTGTLTNIQTVQNVGSGPSAVVLTK